MPVAIAGMHRSGTSMVTHLLNLCGMYLGPEADIYPPSGDNTEGFWENKNFVEINNEILAILGGSWDLPPTFEAKWHLSSEFSNLDDRARDLIAQFKTHTNWGWKDPRNSLTLPFWQERIPGLKIIVCLRNPYEIAQSLSRRGYTTSTFSYHLWESYYQALQTALSADTEKYIVTHYDSYFIDSQAELKRLLGFLELSVDEDRIKEVCKTASTLHKHNHSTFDDLVTANAPREISQTYVEICSQVGEVYWGKYYGDIEKTPPIDKNIQPELSQKGLLLRLSEQSTLLEKANNENKTRTEVIKQINARLTNTEYDLSVLQDSMAVKALLRYREYVERFFPEDTIRRKFYTLNGKILRILLTEGPRGIWQRIQARRHSKSGVNITSDTQKKTNNIFAIKKGKNILLENQGKLNEIYINALSVANGERNIEYVPISQDNFSADKTDIKLIAFYLPQFHPIPENNTWWGKGFTEWANVSKAVPQYAGHHQPHLPGELGFYDLRLPETQHRQVELAKQYGIFGFSFYYYWFNGKRLLERPLDQFIADPKIDFPFCLCWANENWTRRWDGQENEILIGQNHSIESDIAFIKDIEPYLRHKNYIKIDGRPVLIVYRPQIMPDPAGTAKCWKEYCKEKGLGEIYLVAAQTFGLNDPRSVGFDAAVEFPPHGVSIPEVTNQVEILNPNYAGKIYNYQHAVGYMMQKVAPDYPLFRTVMTSWDNTARRQNHAHMFINSSPSAYESWLTHSIEYTRQNHAEKERFVFINAWNEWAEGTYLEPDRKYGYAYLQSTMDILRSHTKDRNATITKAEKPGALFEKISKQHDTAVILHIYYPELWDEINSYLANLNGDFDLFISLPNTVRFEETKILQDYPNAHIYRGENVGRDIAPFIKIFTSIYSLNYKYICKIHTKKTTHRENGEQWRKDLLNKLLGSNEIIKEAKEMLDSKINIGFVAPSRHVLPANQFMAKNENDVSNLAKKAGIADEDKPEFNFIAGSMFWFKSLALAPLVFMNIKDEDFGPEKGLKDGTLAHAFERFLGLLALKSGYQIVEIGKNTENSPKYNFAAPMRGTQNVNRSSIVHQKENQMNLNINLPDFLIIGAQKAGTTSLYYYCKQHPDIFMPATKEPMFFNSKHIPSITLDKTNLKTPYSFFTLSEYATLFEAARQNQIIGEASTAYLANPDSAVWMKKIVPNVKIIAIIRNPLARAFSAHTMYTQKGIENRSFEEAITAGLENKEATVNQGQRYLTLGLYASLLTPFTKFFPKEQIFIGDYDEYNRNNVEFLQRIFRFLQVKEFVPDDLKRLLVSEATSESSKFSGPIEEQMKAFFKKDVELLQNMVDFDVKKWIT